MLYNGGTQNARENLLTVIVVVNVTYMLNFWRSLQIKIYIFSYSGKCSRSYNLLYTLKYSTVYYSRRATRSHFFGIVSLVIFYKGTWLNK